LLPDLIEDSDHLSAGVRIDVDVDPQDLM